MSGAPRPARAIGINHVALEVGDVDQALEFYGRIFAFELRERELDAAFVDLGDQFLALMQVAGPRPAGLGHFGLVVEDRSAVRALAEAAGARILPGPFLDFLDPWGNRIEVVEYARVQFAKAPAVLRGMGLLDAPTMAKTEAARAELAAKGMAE